MDPRCPQDGPKMAMERSWSYVRVTISCEPFGVIPEPRDGFRYPRATPERMCSCKHSHLELIWSLGTILRPSWKHVDTGFRPSWTYMMDSNSSFQVCVCVCVLCKELPLEVSCTFGELAWIILTRVGGHKGNFGAYYCSYAHLSLRRRLSALYMCIAVGPAMSHPPCAAPTGLEPPCFENHKLFQLLLHHPVGARTVFACSMRLRAITVGNNSRINIA